MKKIFVAGHNGLVGSSVVRAVEKYKDLELLVADRNVLDLRRQDEVEFFFRAVRPDYVVLAAAKVGGILANSTYPAEFIYENLAIQTNVIHAAYKQGVEKTVVLGSSCIYPKMCSQPIKEEYLLTGPLETTNEAYAVAKIAGLKMAEYYAKQYGMNVVSLMPTNLYGINDNFDRDSSHVMPALMSKFYAAALVGAKEVECWGTGLPRREFLHVDDLASAIMHVILTDQKGLLNVGTGTDITIKELSELVANVIGYRGTIKWDSSKPDGTPRKVLDITRIKETGWEPKIRLEDGIRSTFVWYKNV